MRLRTIVLFLVTLAAAFAAPSLRAQTPAETPVPAQTQQQTTPAKPAYSLPPEKLKQAIDYSRIRVILDFLGSGWGILQLVLLLALGIAARMRNFAVNLSKNRWVQGFVFTFLFLLTTTLLGLPLDMYGHHAAVAYGQSVQHWGSWFGDQAKSFGLSFVFGGLFVMLLFWVIRKSPTRWWFWFWIPARHRHSSGSHVSHEGQ